MIFSNISQMFISYDAVSYSDARQLASEMIDYVFIFLHPAFRHALPFALLRVCIC